MKVLCLIILLYFLCQFRSSEAAAGWVGEIGLGAKQLENYFKTKGQFIETYGRQLMMQQFYTEERLRTEGQSGIVQNGPEKNSGTKSYHQQTHRGHWTPLDIWTAASNEHYLGRGGYKAIINGIGFKVRDGNDRHVVMPNRTSSELYATQDIERPPVPATVLNAGSVENQVKEMKEYFIAFQTSNSTHRNYHPYFRPLLCYLEINWEHTSVSSDSGPSVENFSKHMEEIENWSRETDKEIHYGQSGDYRTYKFGYIDFRPTKLMSMVNATIPNIARLKIRQLCHPIEKDIPINRLHYVDDLAGRLNNHRSVEVNKYYHGARFIVDPADKRNFKDGAHERGLLDDIMEEIPGLNNHQGALYDDGIDEDESALNWNGSGKKDVSRYHRWFKISNGGNMETVIRSFNDPFLFAAKNTQRRVAGVSFKNKNKCTEQQGCPEKIEKWSWAIPLEIVFMTPLQKWNPYNLNHRGNHQSEEGKKVSANGRDGSCSSEKAYDGVNDNRFFLTPAELFLGTKDTKCVRDGNGNVRRVRPSGFYHRTEDIEGIGGVYLRYPIYPVHAEGNTAWKELEALKEIIMNKEKFAKYIVPDRSNTDESSDLKLELGDSNLAGQPIHRHPFTLTASDLKNLRHGVQITVTTEQIQGHDHTLVIRYNGDKQRFEYATCDGQSRCGCGHPPVLLMRVTE